ncbi:General substrate transporter [Macrophomina phaseolina MS6]|uniref:General substrate transporter n=2 Tax=Macrophomina phaseolina TaxID=35725 RepID=K2S834_MACPH|nr:General substrate transporter [Macrophomina phaseolina MS6]KAH7065465.1 major facilitator superfamily domain-containing protein [Macrophomina phaseolina]
MPYFLNPFHKHDVSEFPGVLVPLASAQHRRSSVIEKTESPDGAGVEESTGSSEWSGGLTIESLRSEIDADLAAGGVNTAYDRKSKVINKAIQDIGMGRYQWELFALCGFGWTADNLWLQGVALTLPKLSPEFGIDSNTIRYTTLALFTGLCIGASFWGIASDVIGRRLAFNATLFIAGAFGLAAGGGHSWIATCSLFACLGAGVGGNLPVDGALFLEFLPFASGNLLTLLSVWWPVGQLVASLIAWGFIPNYSCADDAVSCKLQPGVEGCCEMSNNWGWRYFVITQGAITFCMFVARFFLFHLFESPKFLLSRGRQAEAVAVVHGIAYHNKAKTWLTEEILNEIGGDPEVVEGQKLSTVELVKRNLSKFSTSRIGPLFNGWKLGTTTALIWFMWATIGMGYPLFNAFLPQYLANSGSSDGSTTSTYIAYRNYVITSVVGVPGSIIACYTVDIKYVGRKGTMAISTLLSGIFLYLFTLNSDSNYQLIFSSLEAFFQNIMYGVLYAYTPEVFPAPNRGTGTGIASFLNRVTGLCAPIVAINAGAANPSGPVYASGALFLAAFVAMLLLPIETRGKQAL